MTISQKLKISEYFRLAILNYSIVLQSGRVRASRLPCSWRYLTLQFFVKTASGKGEKEAKTPKFEKAISSKCLGGIDSIFFCWSASILKRSKTTFWESVEVFWIFDFLKISSFALSKMSFFKGGKIDFLKLKKLKFKNLKNLNWLKKHVFWTF